MSTVLLKSIVKDIYEGTFHLKEPMEAVILSLIKVHVTSDLRKVLPNACKEDVGYWTFFGAESSEALRQYINWRKEKCGGIQKVVLMKQKE
ncbi:MAG: hypothetical protein QXM73_03235 [Candidatus Nezhaarchaeales archaeon]